MVKRPLFGGKNRVLSGSQHHQASCVPTNLTPTFAHPGTFERKGRKLVRNLLNSMQTKMNGKD
jgi:hypothetical protein